jgi:L-cysteine desulfidase
VLHTAINEFNQGMPKCSQTSTNTQANGQSTKKDLIRKHYKEFVKFVNDIPFDILNI